MSSPSTAKELAQLNFAVVVEVLYMRTIEEISAGQYESLRAQPLARVSRYVIRLPRAPSTSPPYRDRSR
jgi:hypothetical protein